MAKKNVVERKTSEEITVGNKATTALTTAPNSDIWSKLDYVLGSKGKDMIQLSAENVEKVNLSVHAIASNMREIYAKWDAVAAQLAFIHSLVGGIGFAYLTENVFPLLGIKRSKADRMVKGAKILREVLPSSIVRNMLLERSGKSFVTTTDKGAVCFTPAFEGAIKALPMPKTLDESKPAEVDAYASALLKKINEIGAPPRKTKAEVTKAANERMIVVFQAFIKNHGTAAADQFITDCAYVLDIVKKTIEAPKPAAAKPESVAREIAQSKTA
jgi:hypothetical protein